MLRQLWITTVLAAACYAAPAGAQDRAPGKDATVLPRDTVHYGPVTIITDTTADGDTKAVKAVVGHSASRDRKKNIEFSYLGFEIGLNNFSDRSDYGSGEVNAFAVSAPGEPEAGPGEFSLRTGKSVNVNIWPVWMKVNLIDHKLNLKTGFGAEMNNYRYSKDISYYNDASRTYVVRDSVRFKKNKLFTEYFTIPLLLDFETNPYHHNRSFRLAAGPTFGYLIKSRTKQISRERGKKKHNDPFNLEQFRMGLRGEIGFGPVTIYGSYSLTPIHQYGLKQYPYSIGLALVANND